MQRIYVLATLIFLVSLPIGLGQCLYRDFEHPEKWDQDPMNDPRIYLSLLGAVVVASGAVLLRRSRVNARIKKCGALLNTVIEKQREGKWDEAEKALQQR